MIMDDNRIMEAAKLIANSSAALIQAIGMMSENIERANRGESLAYTEDSFMKLIQDNGITYNDVIQRGLEIMKDIERVNAGDYILLYTKIVKLYIFIRKSVLGYTKTLYLLVSYLHRRILLPIS